MTKRSSNLFIVLSLVVFQFSSCADVRRRPTPKDELKISEVGTRSACPILSDGETELDCPYAGIVRDLKPFLGSTETTKLKLKEFAPEIFSQLERESSLAPEFKMLWGKSLNFDANAKAVILSEVLFDTLSEVFGSLPARDDRVVHAGIEHTYGYLFSNLNTPYGFKRLRWVRPDIEKGFGLSPGSISPLPKDGGLFANVTYFAGKIAFRTDPKALEILETQKANVSKSIVDFDYSSIKATRLEETVEVSPGRTVVLRTDLVPFTLETGANAEVLIYSVSDSSEPHPVLITMFPVDAKFRSASYGPFNPSRLGENQVIKTTNNGFVSGLTDSGNVFKGSRKIVP